VCIQFAKDPLTTILAILFVSNCIVLAFGFLWNARGLKLTGGLNMGAMAGAIFNRNVVMIDPIITTVCLIAPLISGYIAVDAYRCMNTSNDGSWEAGCTDVDVGEFAWTVDLPFYMEWLRGTFQWFIDLVNRIPEGLSWLNLIGAFGAVILSVFYWDWCSGDDSDDKGERPPADPGISKEEARMLVALARQPGQTKPTSGIAAAITQFRLRGERKFRNQTLADLPIRWNRFKAKLQGVSRNAHAERKRAGGVSIRVAHMATTLPLIAPNRP
jgi:hypothetical protein